MSDKAALDARQEWERKLFDRATTDPHFRRLLRTDPQAAATLLSAEFPPGVAIRVLPEQPRSVYLVIPPLPALEQDGEQHL
jgi:hypothetical protein